MTVKSAATLTSNILRRGGGAYGYYYVGLIVGGYDKEGGHVYSLDAAGGSIPDNYISVGSGSPTPTVCWRTTTRRTSPWTTPSTWRSAL